MSADLALHNRVVGEMQFYMRESRDSIAWAALLEVADRHSPRGTGGCDSCWDNYDDIPAAWPCADYRICSDAAGVEVP